MRGNDKYCQNDSLPTVLALTGKAVHWNHWYLLKKYNWKAKILFNLGIIWVINISDCDVILGMDYGNYQNSPNTFENNTFTHRAYDHSAFICQQLASTLPGVLRLGWGHNNLAQHDTFCWAIHTSHLPAGLSKFIRLQVEIFTDWHRVCVVCSFLYIDWQSSAVWIYLSLLKYSSVA